MKRLTLLAVFILTVLITNAQKPVNPYAETDKKVALIPQTATTSEAIGNYIKANFESEQDRARAAYVWIANHIDYDADNMYAVNFYETDADRVKKVLATGKGICAHYAALYQDICRNAGLKSYIIDGYTKQGTTRADIPHAWCAVQIDNTWYLTDPTWGAGYLNGGKYQRKLNNEYFKVSPTIFIKTHMPFDYLWQFMNNPITPQEFYDGKIAGKGEHFSYTDSIAAYDALDSVKQMEAVVRRIEKSGMSNSMIFDRYQHLKIAAEQMKQNRTVNLYNSAAASFNQAVGDFNDYINYYNKQFTPMKPDAELAEMLNMVDRKLKAARTNLADITDADGNLQSMIAQTNKSIDDMNKRLDEQQEWMKKYLAKGKLGRKTSFSKYTWMGVPLN